MVFGRREVVTATATASKKKDNKPVALVTGQQFASQLRQWKSVKEQLATLMAEKESLDGSIKATCIDEYARMYKNLHKNPGTINIESELGDKVMLIPQHKYLGDIDEDRANELRLKYGRDIIEEKSEMIMNNDLLNKYSAQLEKLIMGAKFMTNEEKEMLFTQKITYKFRPDALDDGFTVAGGNIDDFLSDLHPEIMLKNTK